MSKSTAVAYKHLADLISAKRGEPYGQVISWVRIKINFSLLKSSINAIRGYRSSQGRQSDLTHLHLSIMTAGHCLQSNYCNYACMAFLTIHKNLIFLLLWHNNTFSIHARNVLWQSFIIVPYNTLPCCHVTYYCIILEICCCRWGYAVV